jgi:DNA-binding PadR family transcriptional regulator
MARPPKGDVTASMVVLGLLRREPDTAAGVKNRLARDFPSARWTRSIGHSTFANLAEQGSIHVIESGARPPEDRYGSTPKGSEEFLEWLHAPLTALPALRDALQVKLMLCEPDELPWFAEAIKEQEEACFKAAEQAQLRRNNARREGLLGSAKDGDVKGWLQGAMMADEVSFWTDMGQRKKRVAPGVRTSWHRRRGI